MELWLWQSLEGMSCSTPHYRSLIISSFFCTFLRFSGWINEFPFYSIQKPLYQTEPPQIVWNLDLPSYFRWFGYIIMGMVITGGAIVVVWSSKVGRMTGMLNYRARKSERNKLGCFSWSGCLNRQCAHCCSTQLLCPSPYHARNMPSQFSCCFLRMQLKLWKSGRKYAKSRTNLI